MGLLDETKLDWGNPDAVQLRTCLVEIFTLQPPIYDLAGIARLDRGMIVWDGRPLDKWSRVLERAAEESKMRALLDAVLANGLTANHAKLRGLIQRLQSAEPAPPADFDPYSIGLLPARRAFIDRIPLRTLLRTQFANDNGYRVLRISRGDGVIGVTYSWHLIKAVGERTGKYDAFRIDLKDATSPQTPRDVFDELCRQLEVKVDAVDPTAQPDTVVRQLLASFKALGRSRTHRTCLVFDGFTVETADDWARKLVKGMAKAASEGEAGDLRIVFLWVDSEVTGVFTNDSEEEVLGSATVEDLQTFFRKAAEAAGEIIDEPAGMEVLMKGALGDPPYSDPIDLGMVGPVAARLAGTAFGGY